MGWTYTDMPPEGVKAYFERNLTHETEKMRSRVLRSAFFGRFEFYAAVERTAKQDIFVYEAYLNGQPVGEKRLIMKAGERKVECFVAMVRYVMNGSNPFGYKDMSERDGPTISNCPLTILDMLTPLKEPTAEEVEANADSTTWAWNWRKRCRENAAQRKLKRQVRNTRRKEHQGSYV